MKTLLIFILNSFPLSVLGHDSYKTHGNSFPWHLDEIILGSLAILTIFYLKGLQNLKIEASSVGTPGPYRIASFFLSLFFLVIALISPLVELSNQLSYAHMIQHMILMMVAAPLFVMSAPMYVLMWSLPRSWKDKARPLLKWLYGYRSGRYFFWQPAILWLTYALILWVWHIPQFYEAALKNQWLHDFQHISFFVASCLFCRVLLDPFERLKLRQGQAIIYLFGTSVHATLLGALMTLSPRIWYGHYESTTLIWNYSALEDQQLAGLIMWMPACTVYLVMMVVVFMKWFTPERNYEKK